MPLSDVIAKIEARLPNLSGALPLIEKTVRVGEILWLVGPKLLADVADDVADIEAVLHDPAALRRALDDLKATLHDIEAAWPEIVKAAEAAPPADDAGAGAV